MVWHCYNVSRTTKNVFIRQYNLCLKNLCMFCHIQEQIKSTFCLRKDTSASLQSHQPSTHSQYVYSQRPHCPVSHCKPQSRAASETDTVGAQSAFCLTTSFQKNSKHQLNPPKCENNILRRINTHPKQSKVWKPTVQVTACSLTDTGGNILSVLSQQAWFCQSA